MPLLVLDVNRQCLTRVTSCSNGSSNVVLVNRIPLFVSLQQCIEHLEPTIADTVTHVQVATVLDEPKYFALLLKCLCPSAAANLVSALDGTVGPSVFNEVRLGAAVVSGDFAFLGQSPPAPHRARTNGNSPLQHPADGGVSHCPICLDTVDGWNCCTLTTICSHTFHLHCIARCTHGEPCPLCRFDMLLLDGVSECSVCSGILDLWMCLVCGAVNCGRSKHGHANAHFRATSHSHACQVGGSRVWDYAADAFVHHLAIPEDGGAPVPSSFTVPRWCDDDGDDELLDEVLLHSKVELVNDYYSRLLNSQLEQQQVYFEGLLTSRNCRSVAQLELAGRDAIVRQSVHEARFHVSSFTAAMRSLSHAFRKREEQALQHMQFLSTTVAALQEGNTKLSDRIANFRPNAQIGLLSAKIAHLETEVARLFDELAK
jgi:hypothetical protein